jgi:hypothetical protein
LFRDIGDAPKAAEHDASKKSGIQVLTGLRTRPSKRVSCEAHGKGQGERRFLDNKLACT